MVRLIFFALTVLLSYLARRTRGLAVLQVQLVLVMADGDGLMIHKEFAGPAAVS